LVSASDFGANYSNAGQICLRSTMPQSSSELNVVSTHGCAVGSLAILVQGQALGGTVGGSCTVMQITQVQDQALKIQHNPGQGQGPSYNPPASYQNSNNWPAYSVSSGGCEAYLVCMGALADAVGTTFTVDATTRELRRDGVSIASGIMDMQAQYGLVNGASGALNTWQEPTGTWAAPTPPATLTQAQVRQIKAVRVALIARSGEYEKPTNATNTCDTTTTTAGLSTWATFDTTNWPANWQCYRYKVFETVIPLRNVIWSAS
jgi:type IV pilus assembly protein PilW